MKRMLTALAAVSVLGVSALASAAPHYNNYRSSGGGGGRTYTRATTTVRSYGRPAAGYVRGYNRPALRVPARTFVRHVSVRPRVVFDYGRAHLRAASFARYTHNMWLRARAYRHWNGYQLSVLSRLEALNAAASSFMVFNAYTDIAAKQAELARIEAEFAYLRANGAFLTPYGSFAQLANSIAQMRAQLAAHIAATQAAPQPQPVAFSDGNW